MEFKNRWERLIVLRPVLIISAVFVLWFGNWIGDHFLCKEKIFYLQDKWDDAVSWDLGKNFQKAYPNPSSNPWSELLIGDSSFYRMRNIRAYFRFNPDLPEGSRIVSARIVFRCSAGGQNRPKLRIHYIDAKNFSFEGRPWRLPRSAFAVDWLKEKHNWDWATHDEYQTPELRDLIQDYFRKRGGSGPLGIVIMNRYGNRHQFKGICSFDDEPERAAKLVIRYR